MASPELLRSSPPARYWSMGFDPTRRQRRTRFDYWYVAIGLLVCVGLILWAVLA